MLVDGVELPWATAIAILLYQKWVMGGCPGMLGGL